MLRLSGIVGFVLMCVCGTYAQAPSTKESTDDYMRATEYGLRFTPGMAKAIMDQMVKGGAFTHELDIPKEKSQEAADAVMRRTMQMFHKSGQQGQAFAEFALETMIANDGRITPESGKQWAELSKPLIPVVREMMIGIADDLRPMVPPSKLPSFAGKMMLMTVGLDAYEKKMEQWAQGKAKKGEDLFDSVEEAVDNAEHGRPAEETTEEEKSRRRVEQSVQWETTGSWRHYLERAASFYQLTDAQKQSGESILRELEGRAKQIMTEEWRKKAIENRMKYQLLRHGPDVWNTPWQWKHEREYEAMMKPIKELTAELRDRLEQLPTAEQRTAAEGRIQTALAERTVK